ncbi:Gibberellin regulated protein [Artemisia annua]|uniref:Gibberellin regulated protein n=1 Tax=Artemisia annua TaxID=35608 RepID=A0A2U1PY81_ARTAN|nr:Gibberellin regulated protein [Artemisia annua]
MKLALAPLVIVSLVVTFLVVESSITSTSEFGCDKKCELRCSRSGRRDRCLQYCGICCGKCNGCVPLGPYADRAECPCYHDLKSSKGTHKCP